MSKERDSSEFECKDSKDSKFNDKSNKEGFRGNKSRQNN